MKTKRKPDPCWKQITLHYDTQFKLKEQAWNDVERVERICQSDLLYFAHYTDANDCRLVVKIHTAYSRAHIRRRLRIPINDIVVMPEPGSATHGLGYRIIKHARNQPEPDTFIADVMHWMMNMRGHSYLSESAEHMRLAWSAVQNLRVATGEVPPLKK